MPLHSASQRTIKMLAQVSSAITLYPFARPVAASAGGGLLHDLMRARRPVLHGEALDNVARLAAVPAVQQQPALCALAHGVHHLLQPLQRRRPPLMHHLHSRSDIMLTRPLKTSASSHMRAMCHQTADLEWLWTQEPFEFPRWQHTPSLRVLI